MSRHSLPLLAGLALACSAAIGDTLDSTLTYQGRLTDGGTPATGIYDFEVCLFSLPNGGTAIGCAPLTSTDKIPVEAGLFTLPLDFGANRFLGDERFIEIRVRPENTGAFEVLAPRQLATATPEALHAAQASSVAWDDISKKPAEIDDGDDVGITQITTGPGLSGGPITTTGQIGIDLSVVQARVDGACTSGAYIQSIDADGGVNCDVQAGVQPLVSVVTGGGFGGHLSMVIGDDGFPLISFYDVGMGNLKLAKCNNSACIGNVTIETLDGSLQDVGQFNSMALDVNGNPIISYFNATTGSLQLATCSDTACQAAPSVTVVDAGNATVSVGQNSSMVVRSIGNPVIAYRSSSPLGTELKLVVCGNASCTGSGTVFRTPDAGTAIAGQISLKLRADGRPAISYFDLDNAKLRFARCNTVDCTTATVNDVTISGQPSTFNSLALRSDGRPLMTFFDATAPGSLVVASCADEVCGGMTQMRTLHAAGTGKYNTLLLAPDGLPFISYWDQPNNALRTVKCLSTDCMPGSGLATFSNVDATGGGEWAFAMIGHDLLPLIAYQAGASLRVAKCGSRTCL